MQDFFNSINATITSDNHVQFDDALALNDAVSGSYITLLPHYSFLQVAGLDALTFLQGQVTCDVADVTEQQVRPGAHCTHKGRMIGSFTALTTAADTYLLQTPKDNAENLLTSLKKYIVFSKADIEAVDNWLCFGLKGADSETALKNYFGDSLNNDNASVSKDGSHCYRMPNSNRFVVLVPAEQASSVWQQFSQQRPTTNTLTWLVENCRDGLAEVSLASKEVFIPQSLNLQETAGVSFTKGCYTGQEIVARMKYLGKQKRHMAYFSLTGTAPAIASNVFTQATDKSCGEIIQTVQISDDTVEGLVFIADDAIEQTVVDNSKNQVLTIKALSYS